jgi:hypothetical protein
MTSTLPPDPIPVSAPRRHRGRRIALAAGAGLLLVGAAGVGAVALGTGVAGSLQQDTVSRSFSGVREIVVEVDEGTVELRRSADGDVRTSATRHWAPGYEPVLTGAVVNGVLTLGSDCPNFNLGCGTEQQITVPAGTAVRVRTVDGGIDAADLDTPRFDAATVSGPVRASFVSAPEDARVQTVAGPVRVTVPQGSYDVTGETVVGPVHVGVVGDPAATRTIFAKTVSGPIDVVAG